MSDTPKPARPSGNDYLKNLFAQGKAATPPDPNDHNGAETQNPAKAAANILDLLGNEMDMGFIAQYVALGDTDCTFPPEAADASEDKDVDFLTLVSECPGMGDFGIELNVAHHVSAGLSIVFNEETAMYQLDWMYVEAADEEPLDLSCERDNAVEVQNFLTIFASVAMKFVNREQITRNDVLLLQGFYNRPDSQQPEFPVP